MKSHRSALWIATLLLLAFAGWRLLAIPTTYMRDDEEIAFRSTSGSLYDTLDYQSNQDIQAPLWFAAFWGWQQAAGSTEFAGRIFSLAWAMLAAATLYRLGGRWFNHRRFGAFALIALMVNTYAFIFSTEIRPYALVLFVAALSMAAFARWLNRRTWRSALVYGVSVALLLYVHYFLAFLVAAQVLVLIGVAAQRRSFRPVLQMAGALGLGFILWLPQLPIFIHQLQILRRLAEEAGQVQGLGVGTPSTAEPTTLPTILRLVNVGTNGQILLTAVVLVLGLVLLWRRRAWWIAVAWGVGVPAISLLTNLFVDVYSLRYVSYAALGLALSVGVALAAIRRPAWRAGALAAFVGLSVATFSSQLPQRIPYRDLFSDLSTEFQPGDLIFFSGTDPNENLLRWHRNAYLPHDLPVVSASQESWPRRVWFITGDLFNEQVQADFRALETTHPVQETMGDCTRSWCFVVQLMEAPPLDEPISFTGNDGLVPFRGLTVDTVTNESISARLWWQVPVEGSPPSLDYSIGFQLLNDAGQLIAQSDGPINHYGNTIVQTSQMEPGRIYMDKRTLSLPADLPPGEYQLAVVVYQPWDGARLLLPDGRDAWTTTVTIP
ncbi:MAG: glycosyltransferase family 39 protein [Anaerolineae bacterium]